jgi:hypothetical protein
MGLGDLTGGGGVWTSNDLLLSASRSVPDIDPRVLTDESRRSFSTASLEIEVGILEGGREAASGAPSSDSETT